MLDGLGSTVGLFNKRGTYDGGYSYSPYGETRAASTNASVTANVIRYIAGELDASGFYKLGARYLDTATGRFTQMDPSEQEKAPFIYGSNNPINFSDPTGLMTDAQAELAGQVVSAAFDVAAIGLAVGTGGAAALPCCTVQSVGRSEEGSHRH